MAISPESVDGELLYRLNTSTGETHTYTSAVGRVFDHLGTPVAATAGNGRLIWREAFTPFGESLGAPADNTDQQGFTGHIRDTATGLTYMQARYYNPVVGRFLSNDPVSFASGGVDYFNRYSYTANNPVNNIDPDGRFFGAIAKGIKVIAKGGDLGATFAGAISDAKTIFSGDASLGERAFAAVSLASEVASPVSLRDGKGIARAVRGCPGKCFAAGTKILTNRGMVPIEQIRAGDLVLARDAETGEEALKPVSQIFVNDANAIWELNIETVTGEGEIHRVTENHPYWIVDHGWIKVVDLAIGMKIATLDGDPVTITSIINTGEVERTFNFEVADFHTYFVGDQHVLVHNCNVGNPPIKIGNTPNAARSDWTLQASLVRRRQRLLKQEPYIQVCRAQIRRLTSE